MRKKNNQLNDSFRHKNKIDPQNVNKINNFEKVYLHQKKGDNPSSLVDVNDEWPYSHKRSYRSPKEINKFVKEKKLKYKKKANNDELQKNTKLFIKFKNLYNLNYKGVNNNLPINQDKDKIKEKENNKEKDKDIKEKIISTKINNINKPNKERHNNSGLKRKKEANEYYVGNDSLINNNSTLIDPNEYYLNVLESQQLLVNSGLNKIENESDEETEELTDNIEDINNNLIGPNDGNTSKEQIQNIIKKQSKGMKQNNINNNLNINNIKNNLNIFTKEKITAFDDCLDGGRSECLYSALESLTLKRLYGNAELKAVLKDELVTQLLYEIKLTVINMQIEQVEQDLKAAQAAGDWDQQAQLLAYQPQLIAQRNEICKILGNRVGV